MPPKTADEELAELEMLAEAPVPPPKHTKGSRAPRQKIQKQEDDDALKDLEELEQLGKSQPAAPRQVSRPKCHRRRLHLAPAAPQAWPLPLLLAQHARARTTSLRRRGSQARVLVPSTRALRQPKRSLPNLVHPSLVRRSSQGVHGGEADGEDSYPQPLQLLRLQGSKQKPLTRKSRRTKRLNDGQSKYEGT